jgi:hypothetical protein
MPGVEQFAAPETSLRHVAQPSFHSKQVGFTAPKRSTESCSRARGLAGARAGCSLASASVADEKTEINVATALA